jgi:hypothetical protein
MTVKKNTIVESEDIAVTEALTLLWSDKVNIFDKLSAQFTVATHDLDQFVIKGRVSPNGPLQTLYSAAGSYTTPTGRLETCSGDLTVQAAASTGSFDLDVSGLYSVSLYAASVHSGGSVVDLYLGLR